MHQLDEKTSLIEGLRLCNHARWPAVGQFEFVLFWVRHPETRRSSAGWGISRRQRHALCGRSFAPPEKRLRSGWRRQKKFKL